MEKGTTEKGTADKGATVVKQVTDRAELHSFFSADPVACAYQLGDLDDAYFPWCQWWGAYDSDSGLLETVFLLYKGLSVPVALTYGDGDRLKRMIEAIYSDLPDRFYCHLLEDHVEAVDAHYDTGDLRPMMRMALRADDYDIGTRDPDIRRLGHRDTGNIVKLYRHYPDNFFEPYQLETGLYFGIHDRNAGPLIAIAGIHVLSEKYDVGVVGNLVTHPDHRGKQLARRVTARLLNEVFERVSLVALNVAEDNTPAIRTYRHFKFGHNHRFYEGMVRRTLLPRR